jgi:xylan 1,4-beta-xylosidase
MKYLTLFIILFLTSSCGEETKEVDDLKLTYDNSKGIVSNLADPFILKHNDKYYLYGTDDLPSEVNLGFKVYTSDNLIEWSEPAGASKDGRALEAEDSWGNWGFWGAEVYYRDGLFYMFYTVEEHLAVATSKSPLGPFRQDIKKPLRDIREIDPHLFHDDDGKAYMYYVSFENFSNDIYVEELNDDWLSTKPETKTRCIWWTQKWENADREYMNWPVNEGSATLKHKGVYYLFYTGNHFLSEKYAVGYATSDSPFGPWNKYENNPVLQQTERLKGTGHCSFVRAPDENIYMVYHAHKDTLNVTPRKMCFDRVEFVENQNSEKPDILMIYMTDTLQEVSWNF